MPITSLCEALWFDHVAYFVFNYPTRLCKIQLCFGSMLRDVKMYFDEFFQLIPELLGTVQGGRVSIRFLYEAHEGFSHVLLKVSSIII